MTQLKRLAALPEHLRLGVTLPGMRELLIAAASGRGGAGQRQDPDRQRKTGKPQAPFPKNDALNGYTNQYWIPSGPRRP